MNKKDANTSKDIAASIEVCPKVKGLMLAASYYDGNYMLSDGLVYEKNANRDRLTFGGKYENGRLTVRSEYITGKTEMSDKIGVYTLNSDGFYVAGGYWFNMKNQRIRPVARYDFLRQDIENPEKNSTYYMAGIDWWPYNNLRLLVNYTIKDKPGYDNLGHLFQAQLSVKF
jgi:phosphate-selective porin